MKHFVIVIFIFLNSFTKGQNLNLLNSLEVIGSEAKYFDATDSLKTDSKGSFNTSTIVESKNDRNNGFGSGIPCVNNVFWAVTTNGDIEEMEINGGNIISNGIILSGGIDPSLAYCNNLNGGSFSPTFLTTYHNRYVSTYNGTSWDSSLVGINTGPYKLVNASGSGPYSYFMVVDTTPPAKVIAVTMFNGASFTTVYSFAPNRTNTVADMAVDANGNCWLFAGQANTAQTDTIVVISPTGLVVKKIPFSLGTSNGFGMFLMNGIIYIGFGSSNALYPNSLLPITILGNTANLGTALPLPASTLNYGDLAGCNAGTPLSINENAANKLRIYPNPAASILNLEFAESPNEIKISDTVGKLLYQSLKELKHIVDVSQFLNGIYFVQFKLENIISTQKLIIQH